MLSAVGSHPGRMMVAVAVLVARLAEDTARIDRLEKLGHLLAEEVFDQRLREFARERSEEAGLHRVRPRHGGPCLVHTDRVGPVCARRGWRGHVLVSAVPRQAKPACFGGEAAEHLERITGEYRLLSPALAGGVHSSPTGKSWPLGSLPGSGGLQGQDADNTVRLKTAPDRLGRAR